MSLVGFGVKNLRCLTDTGIVPIKPITLLVGKNSSGKSTFLRAFPLLRQSVENARRSPVLWEHPDYVDFGNIDLAINDRAAERSVSFAFDIEASDEEPRCQVEMAVASSPAGAHVAAYDLHVEDSHARLRFDSTHRLTSYVFGESPVHMDGYWLGEVGYLIAPIDAESQGRLIYQPYVNPLRRAGGPGYRPVGGRGRGRLGSWTAEEVSRQLVAVDRDVADFMYRVAYLGPHRSVAARLYRLRDVAVEEVRADGENLANFLALLSPSEMESFATFTKKYLGFEPSVRVDKLTVEILVKEANADRPRNIADVGFGYAEVLPLCAVLWSTCVREPSPTRRQTSLVALEQPELHLHPAHQAKLPRMLIGALLESRNAGREVKLMVETHSDAIVNELGLLIRRKRIDHDDVQILFFDQDPVTRETKLVQTGYEEDGVLRENWPFGFLWATTDEADDIPSAAAEE